MNIDKISRIIPEGAIPLVSVKGTAYECGHQYANIVLEQYSGYHTYLDMAYDWKHLISDIRQLVENRPRIYLTYTEVFEMWLD